MNASVRWLSVGRAQGLSPVVSSLLLPLFAVLFCFFPILAGLSQGADGALAQLGILSDWRAPTLRSLGLIVVAPSLSVLSGFVLGSKLSESNAKCGSWAGILLLPVLLGGGVDAFIFKLCVFDFVPLSTLLQDRNSFSFWLSILFMFTWQFSPCVVFFSWLTCTQVDSSRRVFAVAHGLSFSERLADIYWPQCKNLLAYLFVLLSAAAASEYERSAVVFRASQGTDTEFFSHWLLKAYFGAARIAPSTSAETALFYAGLFVLIAILVTVCSGGALAWTAPRAFRLMGKVGSPSGYSAIPSYLVGLGLVFVLIMPFLPTIRRGLSGLLATRPESCSMGLWVPAIAASATCIIFSTATRFAWPRVFEGFNRTSLGVSLGVAAGGFLPPIAIAFSGMWWLARLHQASVPLDQVAVVTWWVLLGVAALPMFFPGYLAMQFAVSTKELEFLFQHRASDSEVFVISFLKRLWPVYLLFSVFLFGFMWTEYPLTALFSGLSNNLCSPALDLALRSEGKGTEFNEAASIILQLAIPIVFCTVGLGSWMNRRERFLRGS